MAGRQDVAGRRGAGSLTLARIYLAGPDVFLPGATAWLERKKAICAEHGLTGVAPLDDLPEEPPDWAPLPEWQRIALKNEAHIRSCTAVIANMTPFRGTSMDVGTAYEVGFARGLGLRVFGYSTTASGLLERTLAALPCRRDAQGVWWDPDELYVEQFGLFDNLMIEAAIEASGVGVVKSDQDRWQDLSAFERCVRAASKMLADRAEGTPATEG